MKLKTKLMMFTAAMALSSTMAFAAITGNDVVASYQAQSYSYIEVKVGPTQIKVEAIKNGVKVEAIYDKATGKILKNETSSASGKDAARTGVSVRQVGADFDDDLDDSDDDVSDDSNDDDNDSHDHSNDDNDDSDDDNGSDDDNDDNDDSDDDDDSGSDDDNGDDDDGGSDDDNGSDDD